MYKTFGAFFCTLFLWCGISILSAQETNIDRSVLELDIKTSSLTELALWCRSLGLSEGGTKQELAQRLRNYYKLPAPDAEDYSNQRTIIIESARSSEYFTLEVVQEDYVRFAGTVVVSLNEEETAHRISADEILYNRTRNIMSASGNVEYTSQSGDSIKTFRGQSITIDMDTWETILLDGTSDMSLEGDTTIYRFAGTVISHPTSSVTILTDADISKTDKPEALWSIHASKIWLLPSSDFAIFNAVLKVGEIPVFYLPFLHWPADEVIFHPVIGYRSREGNFVQTTTYIWGRPKTVSTTSESSITTVMQGSSDQERRREGIFLRSTGKKATDPNEKRLSILFDFYSNLGAYAGVELALPKKDSRGAITVSAGLGFTRDIYSYASGYSPYDGAGNDQWNTSHLLFGEVPFRYRFNATGSYSWKYSTLTWGIPLYSDPFVNQDFIQYRSEKMDWLNSLKEGAAGFEDTTTSTSNIISSYQMQVNATISPVVTGLNPYITNLSISNLSTVVSFKSRNSMSYYSSSNPSFFYPDKYTIYNISLALAGTPLTYSMSSTQKTQIPNQEESIKEDPLKDIGTPIAPWGSASAPDSKAASDSKDALQLKPPVLNARFALPAAIGMPKFVIDYRFNPSMSSELQFSNQNWTEFTDIDWNKISSVLSSFKSDASINFALSQSDRINYSTFFRIAQNSTVQDYSYLNEDEYTVNQSESIRERAYNSSFFSSTWEFGASIKPFYQNTIWSNSTLQYNVKGVLLKTVFSGTGSQPQWDIETSQWNKDYFDSHQFSINLAASIMDLAQNLNITMDLPPKDTSISANATFRIWRTVTTMSGKISNLGPQQIFELFSFKETLNFDTDRAGLLQVSFTYDPEKKEFRSASSSIAWNGFSATFVASYLKRYELNENGWFIPNDAEEKIYPSSFSLEYNKTFKRDSLKDDKLSFSLSLHPTFNFNLQRYTYSRFSFVLGFTFKIRDFLDITFSSTSENTVVFRYFQDIPIFDLPIKLPGEKNFFIDLLNSLRFDNDMLRRDSGFKLKSFDVNLVHYLGDWNASLNIKLSPYLENRVYLFNTQISFMIQWLPLAEIKSEIQHDKDIWTFK